MSSLGLNVQALELEAFEVRKSLVRLASKETIHIGGDLSSTDIMVALWMGLMNYDPTNPTSEHRDRFVLSKGHASAVMSLCQARIGCFSTQEVIDEYAVDGKRFSMHPCALVNPFVDVSTGSLGHGLAIACGMAAALRLKNNTSSRVYVLMGDGELSEGSIWESAMNASHYKLGNLVAFVDWNGLEADGTITELTGLGDITEKWRAFGWRVRELDGNNMSELVQHLSDLPDSTSDEPTVLCCHTIKGKGVAFMENETRWHAGGLNERQYAEALKSLAGNMGRGNHEAAR